MKIRLLVNVYFVRYLRNNNAPLSKGYRPHLVLHNAIVLMAVKFIEFLDPFSFDSIIGAIIETLYSGVDYLSHTIGSDFDIREGNNIVGYGTVIAIENIISDKI